MWWSLALNVGDQFAAHAQSWKQQQEQLLHQYCQRWGRYLTVVFGAWYGRVEQQRALFDASNPKLMVSSILTSPQSCAGLLPESILSW